ncbi:hypothetical protein NSK_006965 [Nannochloropsis salina CCMP1776]|jgi:NAD-dependent deacetylase|uniref:Deacetylase sirtuin-type domain-containing protein n=1 Tax=Nannochloropsis salina CCMP1776 TaxID=1027361 RepID=A0A4D9CSB5_9STRA|nr:hypothetical protein NSK_006965 [Nannochloropsis salina CCMP1776]|eukprot:TFJ81716.1 hypothetical protein NSK_006965 [Nannochloropsis salina CCMP1776]
MRRRRDPTKLLAHYIQEKKKIAFLVGAGLSAASGVPVFRGDDPNAIWVKRVTSMGTKAAFLRDPVTWYNEFWFPLFKHQYTRASPNAGHEALARLSNLDPNLLVVTQNIDSLNRQTREAWAHQDKLVEIHGRLGLYHCSSNDYCILANETWAQAIDVFGPELAEQIEGGGADSSDPVVLTHVPRCTECGTGYMMPLALMFDEMYDSHAFYQSDKALTAFEEADALVFVGTSFQVNISNLAIEAGPRKRGIPIFNFNIRDGLAKGGGRRYDVFNIIGPAEETMQKLLEQVEACLEKDRLGRVETEKHREVLGGTLCVGKADCRTTHEVGKTVSNHVVCNKCPSQPSAKVPATPFTSSDQPGQAKSGPSYAFEIFPQPIFPFPFSEEDVEIDFNPCYGRLSHPDSRLEANIDSTWDRLSEEREAQGCSALFNAVKFRLAGCLLVKGGEARPMKLLLELWLTDYKTARGTNHASIAPLLQADGLATHKDAQVYLSQKLGVSAILCTQDGDLVFIERSTKGVADFQGYIDTPGGHPEPGNLGLVFPLSPPSASALIQTLHDPANAALLKQRIRHEIFTSAAQEVADEVGVPLDKLETPKLLGLVRQLEFGGVPSLTFLVNCQCRTSDVHKYYAAGPKEGNESTKLLFINKQNVTNFLTIPDLKLAPAARGSLELFMEHTL